MKKYVVALLASFIMIIVPGKIPYRSAVPGFVRQVATDKQGRIYLRSEAPDSLTMLNQNGRKSWSKNIDVSLLNDSQGALVMVEHRPGRLDIIQYSERGQKSVLQSLELPQGFDDATIVEVRHGFCLVEGWERVESVGSWPVTVWHVCHEFRYDKNGHLIDSKVVRREKQENPSVPGAESDTVQSEDSKGNRYVIHKKGRSDIEFRKFDPGGKLVFHEQLGAPDRVTSIWNLTVDRNDNVYLAGSTGKYGSGLGGVVFGRYDAKSGRLQVDLLNVSRWAEDYQVYGLILGAGDFPYIHGTALDRDRNGKPFTTAFVIKRALSGANEWVWRAPRVRGGFYYCDALVTDQGGNAFVTGNHIANRSKSLYLAKLDSAGRMVWMRFIRDIWPLVFWVVRLIGFAILAVCLVALACQKPRKSTKQPRRNPSPPDEETCLAGVSLYAGGDEVRKFWDPPGETPVRAVHVGDETRCTTEWKYPEAGVEMQFARFGCCDGRECEDPGFVNQISVTTSEYPTYRGVKIGDTLPEVEQRYPDIRSFASEMPDSSGYICTIDDGEKTPCEVLFWFLEGRLIRITLRADV